MGIRIRCRWCGWGMRRRPGSWRRGDPPRRVHRSCAISSHTRSACCEGQASGSPPWRDVCRGSGFARRGGHGKQRRQAKSALLVGRAAARRGGYWKQPRRAAGASSGARPTGLLQRPGIPSRGLSWVELRSTRRWLGDDGASRPRRAVPDPRTPSPRSSRAAARCSRGSGFARRDADWKLHRHAKRALLVGRASARRGGYWKQPSDATAASSGARPTGLLSAARHPVARTFVSRTTLDTAMAWRRQRIQAASGSARPTNTIAPIKSRGSQMLPWVGLRPTRR